MLIGQALNNTAYGINRLEALQGRRVQLEQIMTEAAATGRPTPPGATAEIAKISTQIASTTTAISTAKEDAKRAIEIIANLSKIAEAVTPS